VRDVIVVGFLDTHCRESLTYVFEKTDDTTVFLISASWREFRGDTDRVASGTAWLFGRDGTLHIRRQAYDPPQAETSTSSVDVSGNYSALPAFGDYDELIRPERQA
jgi:hypothetical protein